MTEYTPPPVKHPDCLKLNHSQVHESTNGHLKQISPPANLDLFQNNHSIVDDIKRSRDSIFQSVCSEMGVELDYRYVNHKYCLVNRKLTKEKLCLFMEAAVYLLDLHAIPWLEKALPHVEELAAVKKENEALKKENRAYQKEVIQLQKQMIEKQEEQINSVKATVQTELKSFSSAVTSTMKTEMKSVSKSCASAVAPKKIAAAVQKVADQDERSKNVIVYGLKEEKDEDLQNRVELILEDLGENPVVRSCSRVGMKSDATRPVKFSLANSDHVRQVLRKTKSLRTKEGYDSVYVCPDRSLEERRAYKKLVEELMKKRTTETDKVHFIRNNKIVSSERDSASRNTDNT